MNLSELIPAIAAHAAAEAPRECCGVVVAGRYIPCRNAAEGLHRFAIDPADYADAEDAGPIDLVVHSHAFEPATPSAADIAACNAGRVPWLIVNHPTGAHERLEPQSGALPAPIEGREFVHGVHDCYALVRDWYRLHRGLLLRDYARADRWWDAGQNLYADNFAAEGFVPVSMDDLREGDALLIQERSPVVNHAGIYLSGNRILHHPSGRLSRAEVYGQYWRNRTRLVLRHASALGEPAC